ncbi:carbohydrate kinase family protein [Taklimakanibacter deserti]|uniref:carbohydrate kinase family protein n=1 Tax=Taklimakanibacter deserti TaxID=2267839 RepID=UPI0013C437DC
MSGLELFSIGSWSIFDHLLRMKRLPAEGETVPLDMPIEEMERLHFGDCSANIAAVAARLGLRTGLGMVVGDDFETSGYGAHLQALGVDLSGVEIRPGARSGHSFNFFDAENRSFCVSHLGVAEKQDDWRIPEAAIVQARALVVSEMFGPYTLGAIEAARRAGRLTAINGMVASAGQSASRFLAAADILILSRGEAADLVKRLALDAAGDLLDLGPRLVVITEGSDGSRWHRCEGETRLPAVRTESFVDSTGAGDSFAASVMCGLIRGWPIEQTGKFAATVASFVVEAWGCQTNLPDMDRVALRYRNYFKENLIP